MPGRFQRAAGVSSKVADLAPQPSGDAHVAFAAGDVSGRRGAGLAPTPVVGLIHQKKERASKAPARSFRRDHRPWSWKSPERLAPPCFDAWKCAGVTADA